MDAPAPFRIAFDQARDPYTARNALGIMAGFITSVTAPLSVTGGNLTVDLSNYQPLDADLTALAALTGTNTIYYRSAANTWSPVTITAPLAFSGGTLSIAPTWTTYTPTVTAGSGTLTTVSATGRYLTIGKLTNILIQITVTNNGSGASYLTASLPNTANISVVALEILVGRNPSTGKMLQGVIGSISGTVMSIVNYDNTYPAASGQIIYLSGTYENT